MKEKISSKIRQKCKNRGSGIVLVIVAVAFIGILVGSMLTAVGYAYRLKLYDYNAKDNFYYLEQAMDQLYTGVGNDTLARMQESYTSVITGMNTFSSETNSLVSADSDELNEAFKNNFMYAVATSGDMTSLTIGDYLRSFISNTDIALATTPTVVCRGKDGTLYNWAEGLSQSTELESIVIKDIVLTRIGEYKRSTANGNYEQTISADIEIVRPDFEMEFSTTDLNYSALFDFAMVADNGIEIHTPGTSELSIAGNIYAAADFYDKEYNYGNAIGLSGYSVNGTPSTYTGYRTTGGAEGNDDTVLLGSEKSQSSIVNVGTGASAATYYNFDHSGVSANTTTWLNQRNWKKWNNTEIARYDGINEESAYSGLYIRDSKVTLQAQEIIVPGTIAVMGGGSLILYGRSGASVVDSDVWTDNIVLGNVDDAAGHGGSIVEESSNDGVITYNYVSHPELLARARLHVRDDMELNADGSSVELIGQYYGFGNSSKSDTRKYLSFIDKSQYQVETEDGAKARGHFNSSAIVINGQNSVLRMDELNTLFLAGRTYVELSKLKEPVTVNKDETSDDSDTQNSGNSGSTGDNQSITGDNGTTGDQTADDKVASRTRSNGTVDDFRMGESLSIKTNQIAYLPLNLQGASLSTKADNTTTVTIQKELADTALFKYILFKGTTAGENQPITDIPVKPYVITNGTVSSTEYYYDFETIYNTYYGEGSTTGNTVTFDYYFNTNEIEDPELEAATVNPVSKSVTITSADELARQFIVYYNLECKNKYSKSARTYLEDVTASYDGFANSQGSIRVPTTKNALYSSGAITIKSGTNVKITGSLYDNLPTATQFVYNGANETDLTSDPSLGHQVTSDPFAAMTELSAGANTTAINVANLSNSMEERYRYVKWSLENYNATEDSQEKTYIDGIYGNDGKGEGYLTPINRYVNMKLITEMPGIDLNCGYSVVTSNSDVTISAGENGVFQGLVVAKGSVFFDNSVKRFEGLIISGDKIFVEGSNLTSISASPEIIRAILNECLTRTNEADQKRVLQLLKPYEAFAFMENSASIEDDNKVKTISNVQASDVVSFKNWMKNVADVPKTTTAVTDH